MQSKRPLIAAEDTRDPAASWRGRSTRCSRSRSLADQEVCGGYVQNDTMLQDTIAADCIQNVTPNNQGGRASYPRLPHWHLSGSESCLGLLDTFRRDQETPIPNKHADFC